MPTKLPTKRPTKVPTKQPTIAPVGPSWILTAGSVQGLVLTVTFSWSAAQKDLDSGISFLGSARGVACFPDDGTYLTFTGDNSGFGGSETYTITLGTAFADGKWSGSTTFQMRASWNPNKNQGPVTVTMFTSHVLANGTIINDNNAMMFAISPNIRQRGQCASVIFNVTVVRASYGNVTVIVPK
jgi:hypothetical protein